MNEWKDWYDVPPLQRAFVTQIMSDMVHTIESDHVRGKSAEIELDLKSMAHAMRLASEELQSCGLRQPATPLRLVPCNDATHE